MDTPSRTKATFGVGRISEPMKTCAGIDDTETLSTYAPGVKSAPESTFGRNALADAGFARSRMPILPVERFFAGTHWCASVPPHREVVERECRALVLVRAAEEVHRRLGGGRETD